MLKYLMFFILTAATFYIAYWAGKGSALKDQSHKPPLENPEYKDVSYTRRPILCTQCEEDRYATFKYNKRTGETSLAFPPPPCKCGGITFLVRVKKRRRR